MEDRKDWRNGRKKGNGERDEGKKEKVEWKRGKGRMGKKEKVELERGKCGMRRVTGREKGMKEKDGTGEKAESEEK